MTKPKRPVVLCERVDDIRWRFRCPFCREYHVHGSGAAGKEIEGHRVAHCHEPTSPFLETGYILKAATRRAV
jgi:hypothetical protein